MMEDDAKATVQLQSGPRRQTGVVAASAFYGLFRPSKCERRVYLRAEGVQEDPVGPYAQLLRELGLRHERAHLTTFDKFLDLGRGPRWLRRLRTQWAVRRRTPVIYQGALRAKTTIN